MSFCILCCIVSVPPYADLLNAATVLSSLTESSSYTNMMLFVPDDPAAMVFVGSLFLENLISCFSTASLLLLTKQLSTVWPTRRQYVHVGGMSTLERHSEAL